MRRHGKILSSKSQLRVLLLVDQSVEAWPFALTSSGLYQLWSQDEESGAPGCEEQKT